MNEKIDIYELVKRCPDATIQIRIGDLSLFSKKLLADAQIEFDRQRALKEAEKAESYVTAETVQLKFDISDSTLYRLGRKHVLEPVFVAGQRRYRLSDLERLASRDSK